jgi:ribose-phosphate pyrophosphokinase
MTGERAVYGFDSDLSAARSLADALGLPCHEILLHRFPDGESLVRIAQKARLPILYRCLDRPNDKLVELLLAADSLRGLGAEKPILVAPYLPYMRQDIAFHPGEAVSQRVIGALLDPLFAAIITVDPHLHRTPSLDRIFPTTRTLCLSAAPLLAEMIGQPGGPPPLLVGPDEESQGLVAAIARLRGCDFLILQKIRQGDFSVQVAAEEGKRVAGRAVILVDDVCSSGGTLSEAARWLAAQGAASVEALVVHALQDEKAAALLCEAGISRLRSVDTVPHDSNQARLAPLLAKALQEVFACFPA